MMHRADGASPNSLASISIPGASLPPDLYTPSTPPPVYVAPAADVGFVTPSRYTHVGVPVETRHYDGMTFAKSPGPVSPWAPHSGSRSRMSIASNTPQRVSYHYSVPIPPGACTQPLTYIEAQPPMKYVAPLTDDIPYPAGEGSPSVRPYPPTPRPSPFPPLRSCLRTNFHRRPRWPRRPRRPRPQHLPSLFCGMAPRRPTTHSSSASS
jgi:hypothetical protein